MATATHAPAGHRLGLHTLRDEVALESLPVEGEVPAWLQGALVRTGPALFEAGARTVRHLFDGQAMLHRFGFRDGRVDYRNRFLRTRQLEAIEERGELGLSEFATDPCRRLFGRVMASFSPRFTDNGNVNVIALEGEALAVTETPMPVAFDPETLATLGTPAWAKEIPGLHVSAHPHHDPARGSS